MKDFNPIIVLFLTTDDYINNNVEVNFNPIIVLFLT